MRTTGIVLALVIGLAGCGGGEETDAEGRTGSTPRIRAASPVVDLSGAADEDWVQLFDGSTLQGWTPKIRGYAAGEDPRGTFRVEDSLLTVSYEGYDRFRETFGHLFHERSFSWYHLEVEYRFVGEQMADGPDWATRNSGIMVHGQTPQSMGLDQDFPISIEVQLLGGNGTDERSTANLCTPGTNVEIDGALDTRHCISSSSDTYHGDQWVTASVTVFGDSLIVHGVNGQEVLRYAAPQMGGGNVERYDAGIMQEGRLLSQGTISLQSESHPVQFRRVALVSLIGCTDPASPSYRPYFLRSDPSACAH